MDPLTLPEAVCASPEPKLNLLLARDQRADWRRFRSAAAGSFGVHVVGLIVLFLLDSGPVQPPPPERYFVRHVTPLYTPPELTQRAPNKGPVKKELTLQTIAPHPAQKAPAPAPAPKQSVAKSIPLPPAPAPQAPPKQIALAEAPRIEVAPPALQKNPLTNAPPLPPPPGSGAPKITFEDVSPQPTGGGKPTGLIPLPPASVQDAVKELNNRGGTAGSPTGGEITFDQGGSGPGLNLPASRGQAQGGIKLLSSDQGVDFRPYLTQVMAAIRRNWFAVYPEAAKTGMRGEVTLQFRVVRGGVVAKVVYNGQSPSKALNEAAVAAISASNPFPPLPTEFKGDHIDLQMRFLYNMLK